MGDADLAADLVPPGGSVGAGAFVYDVSFHEGVMCVFKRIYARRADEARLSIFVVTLLHPLHVAWFQGLGGTRGGGFAHCFCCFSCAIRIIQ